MNIGGIEMKSPIILGAGVAKHPNQTEKFFAPQDAGLLGVIVTGSYTVEPRDGNRDENGSQAKLVYPADFGTIQENGFALNSYGMPNIGIVQLIEELAKYPTRQFVVSIAGFKSYDYTIMLDYLETVPNVVAVEVNAGCPNTGHLPVAYDLVDLENLLDSIKRCKFEKPVWLKLSPFMEKEEWDNFAKKHPHLDFQHVPVVYPLFFSSLCSILKIYSGTIKAVVMTNTLPNVMYGEVITVKSADGSVHHKGGLSGPILLQHNLNLIRRLVKAGVSKEMDIIGCGGVMTGDDAIAYLEVGCKAVACVSGPNWAGPSFFEDLHLGSSRLQDYLSNWE